MYTSIQNELQRRVDRIGRAWRTSEGARTALRVAQYHTAMCALREFCQRKGVVFMRAGIAEAFTLDVRLHPDAPIVTLQETAPCAD